MVTVMQEGNRRIIAAADEAARRINLHPGMTLAHAQSLVPDLHVVDAAPREDEAALEQLGLWCTRYSPLVTPDLPDGVFIDIAGSAHLFKGETALLQDIASRLATAGINAKVAVADTPGCAWAVARYSGESIVAPGRIAERWVNCLCRRCAYLGEPSRCGDRADCASCDETAVHLANPLRLGTPASARSCARLRA
jgi:protein ImuB